MDIKAIIAGGILVQAMTASATEPLIVAGLKLDEPFTMERCPKARKTNMGKRTEPCWVTSSDARLPEEKQTNPTFRYILWPGKSNPGPFGHSATALVESGILHAISFQTTGYKFQDLYLRQLTEKFGQPTSLKTEIMQNAFGAHFDKIEATWRTEYFVDLEGFGERIDEGSVFIQSTTEHDRDMERVTRARAAHPPKSGL